MFKVTETPEFTHKVPVMVPVDGGHREESFDVRYRVIDGDVDEQFDLQDPEGLKAFLRAAIVRIGDIVDDNDKPLSWNDALRDRILGLPYARIALLRGYMTAITKARTGN
ncbi:hypothetical protein DDZ14_16110 [Maritimibacter sp. 55A14]|uniref:hypothetical protein n=1 Tax=Maritimibacter sp. 55A14 TaxID=2174844 RepID=UPI000D605DB1|nr:hypothetical protein [Maritimibacter sp. 55A14]PWE29965.1 hypothetical protein DDZ14_16110 [Maritimibacter sp. 55A14]